MDSEKQENGDTKTTHSPYGSGFKIRMAVLLGLLGLTLAGFWYERSVLSVKRDQIANDVFKLMDLRGQKNEVESEDGGKKVEPIVVSKARVRETIGYEPRKTDKEPMSRHSDKFFYEVETYDLPGLNPFNKPFLTVVYDSDRLEHVMLNKPYDLDALLGNPDIKLGAPREGRRAPTIGMGGGGGGRRSRDDSSGDDDDDAEDGEEDEETGDGEAEETGSASSGPDPVPGIAGDEDQDVEEENDEDEENDG